MKYGAKIMYFITSENSLWKTEQVLKDISPSVAIKLPDLTIAWPSLDLHEVTQIFYNYERFFSI